MQAPETHAQPTTTSPLRWVGAAGLLAWALLVTLQSLRLAGAPIGPAGTSELLALPAQPATAAAILVGAMIALAAITLLVRPAALLWVLLAATGLVLGTIGALTGSLLALATVIIISVIATVAGHLALDCIRSAPKQPVVRAALDASVGFAALGLLWFILGAVGLLRGDVVILATAVLVAAAGLLARRLDTPGHSLPYPPIRLPAPMLSGVVLAAIWGVMLFAALGSLVPETQSDATKQHLPIAREFWQSHQISHLESMPVTKQAIQQHLLFAVAYGFGGQTAAQLLQAAFGVVAVLGVAAIAWSLSGRTAALCAAAVFGLLPLVLWQLGHAFLDILPVVFTTAAALCVLQWQACGDRVWLVLAGGMCGVGIATKLTMISILVALALGVFVVGRAPWRWQDRLGSTALLGVGALSIVPWAVVNTAMTGTIYGLDALTTRLSHLAGTASAHASPSPHSGAGALALAQSTAPVPSGDPPVRHSIADLLSMPWTLTFQAQEFAFPIIGRGELGIAPLLLAPFTVLLPRRRETALMVLTVAVSFVLWWLTPLQIIRHLLPTLALAVALMAAAVGPAFDRWRRDSLTRLTAVVLGACLTITVVLSPLFFLASARSAIPVDYLLGREDKATFLERSIRSAGPILALDTFVPPDTNVAYLGGQFDAPQIYTEARLVYFDFNNAGETVEATLAALADRNIHYIIWERSNDSWRDSSAVIRSTAFLRQYTRILAAGDDAYLFEVLPAGDTVWGEQKVANLLEDPGLKKLKGKNSPWRVEGRADVADGTIALTRRSSLSQTTPVTPGTAYLLEAPVSCSEANGRAALTFTWLDASGAKLGVVTEDVSPGATGSQQFLWRQAPEESDAVQVQLSVVGPGHCDFSGVALYALS